MKQILHIRTRADDPVADAVAREIPPDAKLTQLNWTNNEPDYEAALVMIFAADVVHVW